MRETILAAATVVSGCSFSTSLSGDAGAIDTIDAIDATDAPIVVPRVSLNLIGLWELEENGGSTVTDSSGLDPVDLTISNPAAVTWMPGALMLSSPVDIQSPSATNLRLIPPLKAADQVTVEAWIRSAGPSQTGTVQGHPARIVTLTVANIGSHLFTLGQFDNQWAGQVLTSAASDSHGSPMLLAPATTELTHLVMTSTPTRRALFVDGTPVTSDSNGGVLDSWQASHIVFLGGDPNMRNSWSGTVHLIAVYDRALDDAEIMQNYLAGP